MKNYVKLTSWLIGAWFVLTFIAGAAHLLVARAGQPPLAFGLAATSPIVVFLVWFAASPSFRQFTLYISPRVLTLVQSWRIGGFVFLVLATYSILPRPFALPAGWGDIVIGATAPLVALKLADPRHRTSFIAWQLLGMADLVTAVTLGTLASIIDPHGVTTSAMTILPLSLIPAFAVPLFFILHIISIAHARQWPARQGQQATGPLPLQAL
jgi:hypothetical protein